MEPAYYGYSKRNASVTPGYQAKTPTDYTSKTIDTSRTMKGAMKRKVNMPSISRKIYDLNGRPLAMRGEGSSTSPRFAKTDFGGEPWHK